ncbi:Primosomal protein N' [Candidatus Xenohaliotis californiensis]|uniref:Replication restart protein PriA n=1 Tax=Candidatus Xenohaliotis californiensis TaxID=84677 RepID=A0ABM9N861_9RICK|nr:Primosomal protein N' [Candidatus Xenohaliotis californiensis]
MPFYYRVLVALKLSTKKYQKNELTHSIENISPYYKALLAMRLPIKEYQKNELTYSTEKEMAIGTIVKIKIREKQILGVIISEDSSKKNYVVFPVEQTFPYEINLNNLKFLCKFAYHNHIEIHKALSAMLPQEPKILTLADKTIKHTNSTNTNLSDVQLNAANKLYSAISNKCYSTTLLYGVVGSGKTEIYLYCIKKFLQKNPLAQILILVPEITLISQAIKQLKIAMDLEIAIWSSKSSSKGETFSQIISGDIKIIVGTRSALLLPYNNLHAIIVDEEHDPSYKQNSGMLYNARNMAVLRGYIENFAIVLCSATPSVESLYNVEAGKYAIIKITSRPYSGLPYVSAVKIEQNKSMLMPEVITAIKDMLAQRKQVLLLLNKRGWRTVLKCSSCSCIMQCPNCSINATIHKNDTKESYNLICHQCNTTIKTYSDITKLECIQCQQKGRLISFGSRVQSLAEEMKAIFPEENIMLITSDNIKTKQDKLHWIWKATKNNTKILIGTQIIAKGHNFPNLQLVIVVDGEVQASKGDFRANEKICQLLHQAIGRSGRGCEQGKAIIQTFNPESDLIKAILTMNYDEFYKTEINIRRKYRKPPFTKCAKFTITCKNEQDAANLSNNLFNYVKNLVKEPDCIHEPQESPYYKIKEKYRYQIKMYADKHISLKQVAEKMGRKMESLSKKKQCDLSVDMDPNNFF